MRTHAVCMVVTCVKTLLVGQDLRGGNRTVKDRLQHLKPKLILRRQKSM